MKILVILFSTLLFNLASLAEDHSQHDGQAEAPAAKPEKKFAADDKLKKRMVILYKAMSELHKTEDRRHPKIKAKHIAQKIEKTVQDIFKTCKLEPAADKALHPILANVLDGARLLKKGETLEGHEKIHTALLNYENYFDQVLSKNE